MSFMPLIEETDEAFRKRAPTKEQLRAAMQAGLDMCTPEEKTRLLEGLLEFP